MKIHGRGLGGSARRTGQLALTGSDTPVLRRAPATAPSRFSQCARHPDTNSTPQPSPVPSPSDLPPHLLPSPSQSSHNSQYSQISHLTPYIPSCRDAPWRVRVNFSDEKVSRITQIAIRQVSVESDERSESNLCYLRNPRNLRDFSRNSPHQSARNLRICGICVRPFTARRVGLTRTCRGASLQWIKERV